MLARKALAGTAGAPKLYVEDVMSCFLYTGNGSTQTITNNIDLSGEGGLTWFKSRNFADDNYLIDSARGITKVLISNSTAAQATNSNYVTGYNNNGFGIEVNLSDASTNYASWTFRKAKKFFDVVTYTGDNTSSKAISHNLGSVPGCVIVKRTDSASHWFVWHRSTSGTPNNDYTLLNQTAATAVATDAWSSNAFTSTQFYVSNNLSTNVSGATYVAYLFAHDAGGFGDAGSDNVISCGSASWAGGSDNVVNLGYEAQWVMYKSTDIAGSNWIIFDTMRGMSFSASEFLRPNLSAAAVTNNSPFAAYPTATGFTIPAGAVSTGTYIYIAIRRGPMKTPTVGTSVFEPVAYSGTSANDRIITASITPDLVTWANRDSTGDRYEYDRLRGSGTWLKPNTTGAEGADGTTYGVQFNKVQTGYQQGTADGGFLNSSSNYVNWLFRRAPGFFDVVCYTGTGSARTVSHNLGAVPEFIIVRNRSNATPNWQSYHSALGNTQIVQINTTNAASTASTVWNNTTPTSSVFTVGTNAGVNTSSENYVAYLFASLSGVSKIGSYTGNGSSVAVTTNFQPRFILVKRTDSTGNWIVGDSARGLPTGNDPALFLNTTAAETTGQDWVDVSSTGFTVNETALNANVNTGTYIYLAIA